MALTKVVYAPGVPVPSTNLNDIQDEVIANGLRLDALDPDQEIPIHSSAMAGVVGCAYVNALSGYWNVTGAPGEVRMPVTVKVGADILSWSADIRDTVTTVTAQLFKGFPGAAPTAIGAVQTSAGSTLDQTLSLVLGAPETVITGSYYWVKIGMPANNHRVYGGTVTRTAI